MPFQPLTTDEVREFEALTRVQGSKGEDHTDDEAEREADPQGQGDPRRGRAQALAEAARKVAERWIAGLAPLEPVLVKRPATRAPRRR